MCFRFRSEFCLQYKEYDSWGVVADYVFQVVIVSALLTRHSTLLVEEFQRDIRIDAPSRSCEDSYGRLYERSEVQVLIIRQGCEHNISFLLVKNRPYIVVNENGG